jgi:hypothetical protein
VLPVSCFGHKDGVIEIDVSSVCPSLRCQAPFRFALLAPDGQILERSGGYGDKVIFDQLDGGIYCLRIYDAGNKCSPDPIRPGEGYVINVDQPLSIKNRFESFAGQRAFFHPTGHNRADGRIIFQWDQTVISNNNVLREVFFPEVSVPRQSFYRARLTNRNNVVIREYPRVGIDEIIEFNDLPAGDYILKITTVMLKAVRDQNNQTRFVQVPSDCEQSFDYSLINPEPLSVTFNPLPASCTEPLGGFERVTVLGGLATEEVPFFTYELNRRAQNENNYLLKSEAGRTTFHRGKLISVYLPNQAGPPTFKPEGTPRRSRAFVSRSIATANGFVVETRASSLPGQSSDVYTGLTAIPQPGNYERFESGEYLLVVSEINWDDSNKDRHLNGFPEFPSPNEVYFRLPNGRVPNFTVLNTSELRVTVDRSRTRRPSCHRDNDGTKNNGSIAINIAGGTPPYTVKWNPAIPGSGIPGDQSLIVVENLRAGVYSLTVTDAAANQCSVVQRIVLEDPQRIELDLAITQPKCNEAGGGQVVATATGGARPYSWNWSSGQIVPPSQIPNNEFNQRSIANNLLDGQHTVRVTDGNGCSQASQFSIIPNGTRFTLVPPTPPQRNNPEIKPVTCFGSQDGSVTANFDRGFGRVELRNPQTGVLVDRFEVKGDINTVFTSSGLPGGPYKMLVFSAGDPSCFSEFEFTIPTPEKITVEPLDFKAVRCKGESNGIGRFLIKGGNVNRATGVPNGADPNTFYRWNLYKFVPPPLGPSQVVERSGQTDQTMTQNNVGTRIEITDLEAGQDYELEIIQVRSSNLGIPGDNVTCRSDRLRFTVPGPRAALTVRLREATPILCNVTNNKGQGGQGYEGAIEADVRDFDFNGIPSGTPPYRFIWTRRSDGSPIAPPPVRDTTTSSPIDVYRNLPYGQYQITVIDANNCIVTNETPFELVQPDFLRINDAITESTIRHPQTCVDRGSVSISWNGQSGREFSGGTPGTGTRRNNYTIFVDPIPEDRRPDEVIPSQDSYRDRITGDITSRPLVRNLVPGRYTVTVRDDLGCFDSKVIDILPPPNAITGIRTEIVQPCPNQNNGFMRVIPLKAGVERPNTRVTIERRSNKAITVLPSANGFNTEPKVFEELFSDVYTVRILDDQQCRFQQVVDLAKIQPIQVTLNKRDVTCFNGTDGSVTATITGGYGPDYRYTFDKDAQFFQNGKTIEPDAADPRYRPLGTYFFAFDRQLPLDTLEQMQRQWTTLQQIDRGPEFNYLENQLAGNPIRVFLSKDQVEFRNRPAGEIYFNLLDNRFFERDGFPVDENAFIITQPSARERCRITPRILIQQPQQFVLESPRAPYESRLNLSCHDAQNDGVIYVQPSYRQSGLASIDVTTRELNDTERWTAANVQVRRRNAAGQFELLPNTAYRIVDSTGADVRTPDRGGSDFIKSGFITTVGSRMGNTWPLNITSGQFHWRGNDYTVLQNQIPALSVTCPSIANLNQIHQVVVTVSAGIPSFRLISGNPGPLNNYEFPSANADEIILATILTRGTCTTPEVTVHPVFETYRIMGLNEGTYEVEFTNRRGCSSTLRQTITRPTQLVASLDKMDAIYCGKRNNQNRGLLTTVTQSQEQRDTRPTEWTVQTSAGSLRIGSVDYRFEAATNIITSEPIPNPAECRGGRNRIDVVYADIDFVNPANNRIRIVRGTPADQPVAPYQGLNSPQILATIFVYGAYKPALPNGGCENRVLADVPAVSQNPILTPNFIGGGKLMATVTGGTPPFRYRVFQVVPGGQDLLVEERSTPNSATASPGTFEEFAVEGGYEYYVEVIANNRLNRLESCSTRTPAVRVDNPQAPEFEFLRKVQDVLCFGQQNGIAEVRARGGVTNPAIPNPSYTYEWRWDEGQETDFLPWGPRPTNLRRGQYTVRAVQVETACPAETTIVIGGPTAAISINAQIEQEVACHDDANGVISTNIMGGTQPYSIQWTLEGNRIVSPLSQPGDRVLGGLRAGRYTILVRDRNNCQQTQVIELKNPEPIFTNISDIINATCEAAPNNANGSFKAKTIGGTKNYEITLQMLDVTTGQFVNSPDPLYNSYLAQDNEDVYFRNLMPGTYRIQVKDYRLVPVPGPDGFVRDYQCTYISERLVIETVSRIRTAVIQTDANGNPRPNAQPNQIFLGCRNQPVFVRVIEQAGHRAQFNPLSYDWGGFGTPVSGRDDMRQFSFNSAGNYTVAVIDQLGCIRLNDYTIEDRSFEVPAASFRVRNVECRGQNNGRIEGRIVGGTMPYSFTLVRGGDVISSGLLPVNADMSFSLSNLTPGSYVLTLTDAEGCQLRLPAAQGQFLEIREAASIFAAGVLGETKPVSCFDASAADGAATLQFIGGQPPYNFRWFDSAAQIVREENAVFQNQFTIINMPFGTSVIEAQDANGCRQTVIVNIGRPQVNLVVTVREDRPQRTCRVNDGQLSLLIDGGRPFDDGGPLYRVTWMQGNRVIAENTTVLSELAAGTYTYRVEDANGCVRMREVVLNGPDRPRITSVNVTPLRCKDGNDAAISITVAGGLPPYTFNWSNGATTQNIANLTEGVYTGTITDANGCTVVGGPITIENPIGFQVDRVIVTGVSACGASDGRIAYERITPEANGPFSFSWRRLGDPTFGSINVADRANLPAGTYEVRITDRSNCVIVDRQTVRQPSSLAVSVAKRDISCNNNNDGSINLTVTGGVVPYTYRWSNGSTEPGIANLTAGTYYGTVTDAEGCFILVEEVVVNPAPIGLASATVKNVSCNGARDGEIRIEVTGGTGRYTFKWSNRSTSQNLIGIGAGTYQGTITDANGCEFASPEVIVTEPAALTLELNVTDAGCVARNDGRIMAEVAGGTPPYTYRWSNGDASDMIMNLEPGNYSVTVTDANGCMAMASGTVDVIQNIARPVLTITAGSANLCVGSAVTIDAGVNPNYLGYLWNDGTRSEPGNSAISFRRDEPGVYDVFVTVTTLCGELNSDTIRVTVTANPAKPVITFNREDSVLVAAVAGNPANLRFQWQRFENNDYVNIGGATNSSLKIDRSGTYRVVASVNNCSSTSDDFDAVLVSRAGQLNIRSLSLYPNPTNGNITLQGDWKTSTVSVDVLNTLGQVVFSIVESSTNQGQVVVDLSSVAAGVYQVRVRSGNSLWTGSVIKN